jgi:hypothetical protein
MVGAGGVAGEIVKVAALESTPEFDTTICTEPEEAMLEAGTMAVNCVGLTKVVASVDGSAGGGFTTQLTIELFTKFVPVTVRTTLEGLHDGVVLPDVVDEDREVIVGPVIVNEIAPDVPPPGPRVSTLTWAVPVARKSAGGTVAVSCVALL